MYYQNTNECDFVRKEKEKMMQAIQVCFDLNDDNQEREINGLMEAMKEFKLKEGVIVTYNQEDEFDIDGKKIKIVPAWKWILEE